VQPIIVENLLVESVTGSTCYAEENGFSALTAYVRSEDAAIVNQLTGAAEAVAKVVIVRCASLEIEGFVGNLHSTGHGMKDAIAINIDDLRYFKPR
jgi:hypothetical protein